MFMGSQVDNNEVIQVKEDPDSHGRVGMQVGAGNKRAHKVTKALRGHFARADVAPKKKVVEFRVTPDAVLPVGTKLYSRHFLAGQYVDVTGVTYVALPSTVQIR